MAAQGPPPTIVLDYGKDVGGIPYFVVRSESGSPVLRSAYSEGLAYLGPGGDNSPSASDVGDSSRVDSLTISSSGRFTTGLVQGGERYERITLASPGSVTLSSIGVRFTAVRATAGDYRGWFDSSSEELDRIWYDGAYTTQLDELPAGTLPAPWRITSGVLDADGGGSAVLRTGSAWTDYTMSFDTRIVQSQSGWVVRASSSSSSSGYLFTLDDSTVTAGKPNTLLEIDLGPGEFRLIGAVALPETIKPDTWHRVSTTVSGPRVTTSIDGRQVATFDTDALPTGASVYGSGTVGFSTLGSVVASFRDLDVTAADGTTLYINRLSSSSALADFSSADFAIPDPLPAIMDGAKRDRVVWSGDLGVEGPNVFYTTGADVFVRASLELLASYQDASGESGTNVPPVALGTFPESGYTYSASYSMDEVDNIATYYLYTGDLAFVRSEWPVITRELAYNQSMVDSRGLLVTDGNDGMDWDYYDGSKSGEVSAYNDIYYETLTDAATMADALGLRSQANTYRQSASNLRSAMNRYLLDPSTGLYEESDLQPAALSQDGNSLAVLFGVAPRGQQASILAALATALPSTPYGPLPFSANTGFRAAVSPFVTNEEVQARFAMGDTASAMALLQTLWGYMDAPGPDDTDADWELVAADGSPGFGQYTSLAHGWSSGATADLSSYVLGVRPTTAGFRKWSVDPHPGSLSWVEGNVPTPRGTIELRWAQHHASGRFRLQVTAPVGTRGTVSVPVPRPGAEVSVQATGAGGGHRSSRVIRTAPGAGTLTVSVTGGATYDVDVVPR
jgi:alpha-L-rhamnosidase